MRSSPSTIVGGGLVGSLLAVYLARRGGPVRVYERGPDLRDSMKTAGRSINLVITHRGIDALDRVGLKDGAMELTVPVLGRMMHAIDGTLSYQPYGRNDSECNYSISRRHLNQFLLEHAERSGAELYFDAGLERIDLETGRLHFLGPSSVSVTDVEAPVVFGADGAGSVVRRSLIDATDGDERIELLDHGYKELSIPSELGPGIERHALHIWPRGSVMLMALPNLDGSFTVTLYLPYHGPMSFDHLDSPERVIDLFESQFPDAVPLIPDLGDEFFENPTGTLGTVRCKPWHHGKNVMLIGDAAHGIVPFFGQGMNCGFEDCAVLGELLEAHGTAWDRIFPEFERLRKPDADAIADMALDNFVEMRDRVGDAGFLLAKQVEHELERRYPLEYRSRYSMVMYSRIPYSVAAEAGEVQQEILDELCEGLRAADQLDFERARSLVKRKLAPLLDRHGVQLDY